MKGVIMKKMSVVLALSCLPLFAHAQFKGLQLPATEPLFRFVMRGLDNARMAKIKLRAEQATAAKNIVAVAREVRSPKMPARRYDGQMPWVDEIKSVVPKLDEHTFFRGGYSSAFDADVYARNPDMPIYHSTYENYSITWDLCQRYIEKVSNLLKAPQKPNHQPKITEQEARELLAEGEGVQWSLRYLVGNSMRKADDAMMKMDNALSDILKNLGVIAGKSSSSLPLPVNPQLASERLKERLDRGLPLR